MKRRHFLFGGLAILAASLMGGKVLAAEQPLPLDNAKILVAYYSYSGNTKKVAKAINEQVGGDIFEIKANDNYPAEYKDMVMQAKQEIQSNYRPNLTTSLTDVDKYDVIFLGSPNWWGTITPQVSSFLEKYNLSGKTVIPFITHGSGGFQNTVSDMTKQCKGCNIYPDAWDSYGDNVDGLPDWLAKIGFKK